MSHGMLAARLPAGVRYHVVLEVTPYSRKGSSGLVLLHKHLNRRMAGIEKDE